MPAQPQVSASSGSTASSGDGQSGTGNGGGGSGNGGGGAGQSKPAKTSLIHQLSVSGNPESLITVTLQEPPGGFLPTGLQLNCSGQATVYWPNGDQVTASHVNGSVSGQHVNVSTDVQDPNTDDDPVSGQWDLMCRGEDPAHAGQTWEGHAVGCTGECPPPTPKKPATPTPRESGTTPNPTPTPTSTQGKSGGGPSPTHSAP